MPKYERQHKDRYYYVMGWLYRAESLRSTSCALFHLRAWSEDDADDELLECMVRLGFTTNPY